MTVRDKTKEDLIIAGRKRSDIHRILDNFFPNYYKVKAPDYLKNIIEALFKEHFVDFLPFQDRFSGLIYSAYVKMKTENDHVRERYETLVGLMELKRALKAKENVKITFNKKKIELDSDILADGCAFDDFLGRIYVSQIDEIESAEKELGHVPNPQELRNQMKKYNDRVDPKIYVRSDLIASLTLLIYSIKKNDDTNKSIEKKSIWLPIYSLFSECQLSKPNNDLDDTIRKAVTAELASGWYPEFYRTGI